MESSYLLGNAFYVSGKVENAIEAYSKGLEHDCDGDLQLQTKLWLNRAQCYLRNERFVDASKDCSLVMNALSSDVTSQSFQKALLRRAQAQEALGNYDKALHDVDALLSNNPIATLAKPALVMRSRLRSFVELDSDVAKQEGRPTMMVTNQQALRLAFVEQPPEIFRAGEPYLIRLCITNELGLWDRHFAQKNMLQDAEKNGDAHISIANIQCKVRVFDMADANVGTLDQQEIITKPSFHLEMLPYDGTSSNPWGIGVDGKVNVMIKILADAQCHKLSNSVVMLHFTLDRPLPQCGEVLPVLSLPARVTTTVSSIDAAPAEQHQAVPHLAGGPSDAMDLREVYDQVLQLCHAVHATCVRQIPISLPTWADTAPQDQPSSASVDGKQDDSFCAFALESPGYLGIAGKVWDSMYVLLQYLSLHSDELVRDKRVIELGCGTGLAGISLCPLSPRCVALTDMPEVVPLISANILLNSVVMHEPHAQAALRDRYEALPYTWGTALGGVDTNGDGSGTTQSGSPPVRYFDTILASDVVYYPEGYQPLLSTLRDLLGATDQLGPASGGDGTDGTADTAAATKRSGPVCILAHRHRHPEDKNFFDALFATEALNVQKLDFQVMCDPSKGADVQALKDVILFRITKR